MSNSPTPRQGILPRSFYLPSSFYDDSIGEKIHELESNRSPTRTDSPNYEKQYSSSHRIPVTLTNISSDALPQSHFSPSTPALEGGFGHRGHENQDKKHKQDGSLGAECQCNHGRRRFRNSFLLYILVALILVLIVNVVFLDIRMVMRPSANLNRAAVTDLKDASSDSSSNVSGPSSSYPVPSSFPSPSTLSPTIPPSSSTNPNESTLATSLSNIPSQTAACISQLLPPSNATTLSDAAGYCTQCVPALQNIPENWFIQESRAGTQGQPNLQAVSAALGFCNNATLTGPT